MDGLRLLLKNVFDYPAPKEYFINIQIESIDALGEQYLLTLHTTEDINEPDGEIHSYNDKVHIGETLLQAVTRAINKDFGITHIVKLIDTDIFETAPTKQGELRPRYSIRVIVPYENLLHNKFQNLYISWVSIKISNEILLRQFAKEVEKKQIKKDNFDASDEDSDIQLHRLHRYAEAFSQFVDEASLQISKIALATKDWFENKNEKTKDVLQNEITILDTSIIRFLSMTCPDDLQDVMGSFIHGAHLLQSAIPFINMGLKTENENYFMQYNDAVNAYANIMNENRLAITDKMTLLTERYKV